jgi:hypothetical protein
MHQYAKLLRATLIASLTHEPLWPARTSVADQGAEARDGTAEIRAPRRE